MHPWHDLPHGDPMAADWRVVVETPHDSRVQYAVDAATGLLRVKRVLFSAVHFPANYGFMPRTLGPDGEALDVLILGQVPIAPMTIVRARGVGVLRMEQAGVRDDKVIAVHSDDPIFAHYERAESLPPYRLAELERFFDDYRALEKIDGGTRGLGGVEEGRVLVREAIERYAAAYVRPAT